MTMVTDPKRLTLNFPNESRSFDASKNRVRFWGYDSSIEISFFVELDALRKLSPNVSGSEADFLQAFDAAQERIHEVADKVYVHARNGGYAYTLVASDF